MYFNTEIAVRYGPNSALIGQNFWYWVNENKKRGRNYHDGHYWVYNSVRSLQKTFPYLSEYQIRRSIKKLVDDGILQKGNYNQTRCDRTTWYTFTDKGTAIFREAEMEARKTAAPAI